MRFARWFRTPLQHAALHFSFVNQLATVWLRCRSPISSRHRSQVTCLTGSPVFTNSMKSMKAKPGEILNENTRAVAFKLKLHTHTHTAHCTQRTIALRIVLIIRETGSLRTHLCSSISIAYYRGSYYGDGFCQPETPMRSLTVCVNLDETVARVGKFGKHIHP